MYNRVPDQCLRLTMFIELKLFSDADSRDSGQGNDN